MKTTHTPEEIAKRIAELPEPINSNTRTIYWYVDCCLQVTRYVWDGGSFDEKILAAQSCFATKEHAKAHADFRKWLYEKPRLTLEECYEKTIGIVNAPQEFIKLARENGHL